MGVALLAAVLAPLPAAADPRENTNVIDNPDLTKACGLDVLIIIDESGSIGTSGATEDVKSAFRAFVASLKNTGSRMAVAEFSSVARLPSIGGLPPGTYITIDDGTQANFNSYIAGYKPDGWTNWEDALRVGRHLAPRPDPDIPHMVVFLTDGDPTATIRIDQMTGDEYTTKVPLADSEVKTNVASNVALTPAIPNANGIKAAGSHIFALGVGAALQNQSSVNRLIAVSGPNVFDGTGEFDISTTDVYLEADFDALEEALRGAAFELCAPSVSIHKLYDPTPDPDTLEDAVPGVGWTLTGTVTVPPPGTFDWVLPHDATGPTADAVTDAAGFATFQWTPTNPDGDSTIVVSEDSAANPPDPPGGEFVNLSDETECTFRTPDTEDAPLDIDVNDAGGFTAVVPPESIVTCQLVNILEPAPEITLQKTTNGVDANEPTGPFIPLGDPVEWEYIVTNTGNTTLERIRVIDTVVDPPSSGPEVDCPSATLEPDDSMTCTADGTAEAGQYANVAAVAAVDTYGTAVGDDDPDHYFGEDSSIAVVKFTNGEDANELFGPPIRVGDDVIWTYEVTNTGNAPISEVVLSDDAGTPDDAGDDFDPTFTGGDTNGDGLLDTDETWLYEATGTAEEGSYANFALVTGQSATEVELQDNDPSHYFGVTSGVTIKKYTNGVDADTPTGPVLRVGDLVQWTYVVTNTGNLPIPGWTVVDDIVGTVGCPRIVLLPGKPVTCFDTGTVEEGQYANVGTVNATDILGDPLTAEDPSHYLGIDPAIELVKFTNDDDANLPTGPLVAEGGDVTWTYEVTNTGTAVLSGLTVVDPRLGPDAVVSCDDTELDPDESTLCTATGTAEVGQYVNVAIAVAEDPFGALVGSDDPSHYFGAASGISLFKYTNGVDANEPPGPFIAEGDEVVWTYDVVNTGNTAVSGIVLEDDQLGPITCPLDTLGVGEEMRCTATGTAERGQYANSATVTGVDEAGTTVSADDPSHYLGYVLAIDIEKSTNGEDADDPTGPQIPVGAPVTWTYEVTNPGDFAIRDVVVTDDQGVTPVFQSGDDNGDDLLDIDETWVYEATGTAEAGQYANVATADGFAAVEEDIQLTDSDPSHYIGVDEGSASLGDTVWLDNNRNGIQEAGEVGIPEALVTVDSGGAATAALAATIQATAVPVTVATGPDGDYLVTALAAGDYVVSLDLSSVDSALTLTTPASYSVTLQVGENFLDADFGLAQAQLPATGSDMDQLAWLGIVMLLIGAAVLTADRRRRRSVEG